MYTYMICPMCPLLRTFFQCCPQRYAPLNQMAIHLTHHSKVNDVCLSLFPLSHVVYQLTLGHAGLGDWLDETCRSILKICWIKSRKLSIWPIKAINVWTNPGNGFLNVTRVCACQQMKTRYRLVY